MSKVLIRYWAYDNCLRNQGIRYTWVDLQRKANKDLDDQGFEPIKKTQFFKDMHALKAPPHLAPIETYKERGQSYYRYSDPNYSIRKQALSEIEAQQLRSALLVLSRFKGMPQFDWVHEIIPKIEQSFNLGKRKTEIIGFDQNIDLKGIDFLGELFNYILHKKVLQIKYKSFTADQFQTQTIHPYYLKQYNNRWFLFGKNANYQSISNLALDRIEKIEDTSLTYIENTEYNFDEYFEDIIGVTKPADKEVIIVKLWFSAKQGPYILTKPLHSTQKKKSMDENGLIITIEVIPNVELEQVILRYGEHCKVLEPKELVDKIKGIIESSLNNYSSG
ncbi:MAG: WYL domain-containing protein [Saprospiraceae bacterium]